MPNDENPVHPVRIAKGEGETGYPHDVTLDCPEGGTVLPRTVVEFSGTVAYSASCPTEVVVRINGSEQVAAETDGGSQPESSTDGPETVEPFVRWSARIDLTGITARQLTADICIVRGEDPPHLMASAVFPLEETGAAGRIEAPEEGAHVRDSVIVIRGWAYHAGDVSDVEIACDGERIGTARIGTVNDGMRHVFGHAYDPCAGFEFRWVRSSRHSGRCVISAVARSLSGVRSPVGEVALTIEAPESLGGLTREEPDSSHASLSRAPRLGDARQRPLNLTVFTHGLSLGGGELYLRDLLTLIRHRFERCAVVSPDDGICADAFRQLGIEVIISDVNEAFDDEHYEEKILGARDLLASTDADIALMNTLCTNIAVDAAQRLGIPSLWAIHESYVVDDWIASRAESSVSPHVRHRYDTALRRASRLLFVAESTREQFQSYWKGTRRAVTVPYGVDIVEIDGYRAQCDRQSFRRSHGIADDDIVLLCVGLYQERKAQSLLIKAARRIAARFPRMKLVLVGDRKDAYSQALYELVPQDLLSRVCFIPATPDVHEWFAISDIFVLVSDIESLPRSMLEAMLFQLPVLGSTVFGVTELVTEGVTGWGVLPNDLESFIGGMTRALATPAQVRQEMGSAARARVRERYTFDNWQRNMLEIVDEVASEA